MTLRIKKNKKKKNVIYWFDTFEKTSIMHRLLKRLVSRASYWFTFQEKFVFSTNFETLLFDQLIKEMYYLTKMTQLLNQYIENVNVYA